MKVRRSSLTLATLFLIAVAGCGNAAETEPPAEPPVTETAEPPPEPMDEAAMMAAMQAAMTPGEEHAELASLEGTFEFTNKMWMGPQQDPVESSGTSVNERVLGGRYLFQRVTGEFMGMPFEGLSYMGYDNVLEKYFSVWIDNMGTGVMVAEGTKQGDETIEMTAEYPDPATGELMRFREVLTITDPDHHSLEMYATGPDGSEYKNLEIHYTKKE